MHYIYVICRFVNLVETHSRAIYQCGKGWEFGDRAGSDSHYAEEFIVYGV